MENMTFSKVLRYVKKFVAMAFLCSFMAFGISYNVDAVTVPSNSNISVSLEDFDSTLSSYKDTNGSAFTKPSGASGMTNFNNQYKFASFGNVMYMAKNEGSESSASWKVYAIGLVDPSKSTTLYGSVNIDDLGEKNVVAYKDIFDGYTGNTPITILEPAGLTANPNSPTAKKAVKFNVFGVQDSSGKSAVTTELTKLTASNSNDTVFFPTETATKTSDAAKLGGYGITTPNANESYYEDAANGVLYILKDGKLTGVATKEDAKSATISKTIYDNSTGEALSFGDSLDLSKLGKNVTTLTLNGFVGSIKSVTPQSTPTITEIKTVGTDLSDELRNKIKKSASSNESTNGSANGSNGSNGSSTNSSNSSNKTTAKSEISCSVKDVTYTMDRSESASTIASTIGSEGGKLYGKVTDSNGKSVDGKWSWSISPSLTEGAITAGKLKFTPSDTTLYSGNPEVSIKVFNLGEKQTFAESSGKKFNQYVTASGVTYVTIKDKNEVAYTWLQEKMGKNGDLRYFAFANGQALPAGTIVSIEWLSSTENEEEFNSLASALSNTGVYFEGDRKYLFKIHAYDPDTFEPIKDFGGKTQDIFVQREGNWDENDIGAFYIGKDGNTEWKSKSVSLMAPWDSTKAIDGELITMTHFSDNVVGDKVDVGQKLGNLLIENWDTFSKKVQDLGEANWTVDNFRKIMKEIVNSSNLSQGDKDAINAWLDSSEGTKFIKDLIDANKSVATESKKSSSSSGTSSGTSGTSSGTSTKTSSGTSTKTSSSTSSGTSSGTTSKSASTKTGYSSSVLQQLLTLMSGSAGAIISLKKKKRF